MSSELRLVARNLGKRYDLFRKPAAHLVKQFVDVRPAREHWALRNLDLEVARGECIGIVGRNGSGKSTLLSLLAGILKPTTGSVEMRGRVAALLELGAGFHPDFTGRENAYLSAAVFGLSGEEVEKRLPSIEEFAGIGDFIDRPVRQYSSGMYARLAFAVAAHVDADILLVDEILGVGDVRFQQRCAQFIRDFRRRGAVVLVSHSEETVLALCDSAVWLADGVEQARGTPREVMYLYQQSLRRQSGSLEEEFEVAGELTSSAAERWRPAEPETDRPRGLLDFEAEVTPTGSGRIGPCTLSARGEPLRSAKGGEDVLLRIPYSIGQHGCEPIVGFALRDRMGTAVFGADSTEFASGPLDGEAGEVEFGFFLPYLPSGAYTIDVRLVDAASGACLATRPDAVLFQVLSRHISAGMASVAPSAASLVVDGERLAP
jgi:lipopolysaccharide transport system ATP-binding protein